MNLGDIVIKITGTTKGLQTASRKAQNILSSLGKSATSLPALLTGAGAAGVGVGLAKVADSYSTMASQLEYVTGSAAEAEEVQNALYEISKQTGTSMEDNANSFVKLAQAQKLTGLTTEQNLDAIKTINTLMIQTGTSGQQASSAMLQLSQALTSGKLAGDEFRSVAENAPGLLNAMGEAMGIPREQLKEMSAAGELTSERLGQAFLQMSLDAQTFGTELPETYQRGFNMIVLALERLWDMINDDTGFIGMWMDAMENLTLYIEENSGAIVEWFKTGLATVVENKDKILQTFQSIGSAVLWVSDIIVKAIEGFRTFYEYFTANWGVAQEALALNGQEQFINNILQEEGLQEEYDALDNGGSGTTIINNNYNPVTRQEISDITNQQIINEARQ